jgi:hypothetical protein
MSFGNRRRDITKKSLDCAKKLKDSFAKVGAYSSEQKFIRGDPEGIFEWISEEVEAFEEILSDRGDFYAFVSARGVATILENLAPTKAQKSPYISVIFKRCIPLGMTLELLHLLFRWHLSSASP